METSPLSIESFSYSWLANLKPSLQTLLDDAASSAAADESLSSSAAASSFIEMDPRMPPSKRFFRNNNNNHSHDFKFDFPDQSSPPIALVHADELFADGYVVPFFLRKPNHRIHHDGDDGDDDCEEEEEELSNSVTSSSPGSTGSRAEDGPVRSGAKTRRYSSFRRVMEKYLELIGPLLGKLAGRRSSGGGPRNHRSLSSRSEGMVIVDSKSNKKRVISNKLAMKRWLSTGAAASSRVSAACSEEEGWRRSAASSCDSESSIQEAVLHCKRSFGK